MIQHYCLFGFFNGKWEVPGAGEGAALKSWWPVAVYGRMEALCWAQNHHKNLWMVTLANHSAKSAMLEAEAGSKELCLFLPELSSPWSTAGDGCKESMATLGLVSRGPAAPELL